MSIKLINFNCIYQSIDNNNTIKNNINYYIEMYLTYLYKFIGKVLMKVKIII